ncbi:MAG: nucleotidyltransferase domain-containing protein [Thermoplasmataceae archaeon]
MKVDDQDIWKIMMASNEPLSDSFLNGLRARLLTIEPITLKLFGSALTKGFGGNDVDLLVISSAFKGVLWQNRRELLDLPPGIKFDLFLFTPEEFETIHPIGTPFREVTEKHSLSLVGSS